MEKIPIILESFGKEVGIGNCLSQLLPHEHLQSADAVACFLLFMRERQKIYQNKRKRRKILTSNTVFSSKWFTNMYRETDRGTMYFRNNLNIDLNGVKINKDIIDENLVSNTLFKSIIYRLINKVETFRDFGGIPNLEQFEEFLDFLANKKADGVVIFTAAHQNMGYDRLMITFKYVL